MADPGEEAPGVIIIEGKISDPGSLVERELPDCPFSSDIVKLIVGPKRRVLNVHKSVLMKADYFASCLRKDGFVEGSFNEVLLPEDDCDSWNQILHFLYNIPLKDCYWAASPDNIASALGQRHLQTYITGDKYCMENLCNYQMEAITGTYGIIGVKSDDLAKVWDKIHDASPLAQYLVEQLASDLRRRGWNHHVKYVDAALPEFLQMHPDLATQLIRMLLVPELERTIYPGGNHAWTLRCKWHIHVKTAERKIDNPWKGE